MGKDRPLEVSYVTINTTQACSPPNQLIRVVTAGL